MLRKTIMNVKYITFLLTLCFFFNCSERKVYGDENPELFIQRFDTDFYQYLVGNELDTCLNKYKDFLPVFGGNILNLGAPEDPDFYAKLKNYFSNPAILDLYKTEQDLFPDISATNSELSRGLDYLLKQFPNLKQPKVFMHVSGWEQKVVVTDDILSLSADFYLGEDYPYYKNFFYDYQRKHMNPDRMVPDYLLGFLMANFTFEGKNDVLLDRMIYEGKLIYILSRLMPDRQVWEYIGYTKDEYLWCSNNQEKIWKTILENQHLYTPDLLITSQYLKDAPHTAFLPTESPGRVGVWVGYQIVIAYMKQNSDTTLVELMEKTDYQEFLKESKYKP